MEIPRVSKSVRRITVLRPDASGQMEAVTLYRDGGSKKKGTRAFKLVERAARRVATAQSKAAGDYLSRHEKSNRKKKDGWVRDLAVNSMKASRKGTKALKLDRLIGF